MGFGDCLWVSMAAHVRTSAKRSCSVCGWDAFGLMRISHEDSFLSNFGFLARVIVLFGLMFKSTGKTQNDCMLVLGTNS